MNVSDSGIYEALCVAIALVVAGWAVWLLVTALERSSPGLALGRPVLAAFGARLLGALALGQLASAQQLRGGDELTFLARSRDIAALPLGGDASLEALTEELHTFLFSLHERVLDPAVPALMLRVEMIACSVAGLTLMAAAVHELAGPRAARTTAWLLAFEPASVFFSSLLHKEPLMFLAEGAVVYGGAVLWKRDSLAGLVPMVLGCLVATATRPYVGWFLAAAAVAVVLHASLTRQHGMRSLVLSVASVALIIAFVPVVWNASTDENLKELQQSQDANASQADANLALERVDYSTREKLITNLPRRVSDVILKPYPWQTQNASQRFGVAGSLVVLATVLLLVAALVRDPRSVMQRAGPLIYPAIFMLVAYSVSAGNAGTAFRYRTHVVAIAIALVLTLRREPETAAAPAAVQGWQTRRATPRLAR